MSKNIEDYTREELLEELKDSEDAYLNECAKCEELTQVLLTEKKNRIKLKLEHCPEKLTLDETQFIKVNL